MKKYITGAICAALCVIVTAYAALDTFVFKTVYQTEVSANEGQFENAMNSLGTLTHNAEGDAAQTSGTADNVVSSNAGDYTPYSDKNIAITLSEYNVNDTVVYVADVQIASAEYLKTAFANDTFGRNVTEKTSEIAAENGAVLAINGDYYGAQERGYVIRNGTVYRATSNGATDLLCVYADGTMEIKNTSEYTADDLVAEGVWQAFSFGPALVVDGEVAVDEDDEVGKAMASNPRTAVGMISANHFLFVVSDGRTNESEGLSLSELAEFMQSLGVSVAYNLDGGGSSSMYYLGEVINNPTTNGRSIKERGVSDIVYIG